MAKQEPTTPSEPTKDELMEQARELDVEGRSTMDKETLAEAIAEAAQSAPPMPGKGMTSAMVNAAHEESMRNAAVNAGLA